MKRINPWIYATSIIIAVIGLVTLLSTELTADFSLTLKNIFVKQIIFVIVGIVVMYISTNIDYQLFKFKPVIYSIYGATALLLLLTLFFGQEVNGARRWLNIAGVQLQPSEFAKITVILVTAFIFKFYEKRNEWLNLIYSALAVLPLALLVFFQPHGSMSILIFALWFITAFILMKDQLRNILLILIITLIFSGLFALTAFGAPSFILLTVVGIIIAVFAFFARDGWRIPVVIVVAASLLFGGVGSVIWNNVLSDYQRDRVLAFQNPDGTDNSASFNVEQSKIAIGSGGVWGKGFANGTQSRLQFLPFHQTDFIFASYAEEFGLIGNIVLLVLYFVLLWNIFMFPIDYPQYTFEISIVLAIGLKFLLEMFINLGTNIGLTPATGIPLPLMSAGGTITIVTFFSLGLIQGIITAVKKTEIYRPKI